MYLIYIIFTFQLKHSGNLFTVTIPQEVCVIFMFSMIICLIKVAGQILTIICFLVLSNDYFQDNFIFSCTLVFCLHVFLCEGIRFPGAGVTVVSCHLVPLEAASANCQTISPQPLPNDLNNVAVENIQMLLNMYRYCIQIKLAK